MINFHEVHILQMCVYNQCAYAYIYCICIIYVLFLHSILTHVSVTSAIALHPSGCRERTIRLVFLLSEAGGVTPSSFKAWVVNIVQSPCGLDSKPCDATWPHHQ